MSRHARRICALIFGSGEVYVDRCVERVDACAIDQAAHDVHLFSAETLTDQRRPVDEAEERDAGTIQNAQGD